MTGSLHIAFAAFGAPSPGIISMKASEAVGQSRRSDAIMIRIDSSIAFAYRVHALFLAARTRDE